MYYLAFQNRRTKKPSNFLFSEKNHRILKKPSNYILKKFRALRPDFNSFCLPKRIGTRFFRRFAPFFSRYHNYLSQSAVCRYRLTVLNPVRGFLHSVRQFWNAVRGFWNTVREFLNLVRRFWNPVREFLNSVRRFWNPVRGFLNSVRRFKSSSTIS